MSDNNPSSMKVFQPAAQAYHFLWDNRALVLRIGILPFLVKLGCYAGIAVFGIEDNFLRQGLFMIPSFFADGLMIALFVVMAGQAYDMDDEGKPGLLRGMQETTKVIEINLSRDKHILASMVAYVLVQVLITLAVSQILPYLVILGEQAHADQAVVSESIVRRVALVVTAFTGFGLLMLPLIFMNVPYALGCGLSRYFRSIGRFSSILSFMGLMFIMVVPVMFLIGAVGDVLSYAGLEFGGGFAALLTGILLRSPFEILIGILLHVAIAFSVYPLLFGKGGKR